MKPVRPSRSRIGVLLSGRGSNFVALAEAIARSELDAEIAIVVSNIAGAPGLERARERGLAARAIPHEGLASRAAHEAEILRALSGAGVDWVCLAGYMRRLSADLVDAFRERMLNVHPSLLPSFPGLHAQRQALVAGVRVAGCTVHFVDDGVDTGPIVIQRTVPVLEHDDETSLSERILREEHRAYPEALDRLLTEPWRIEGRRVRFGGSAAGAGA